jgi:hypothetical protein
MRVILTQAEVVTALVQYCAAQGLQIEGAQLGDFAADGSVQIDTLGMIPTTSRKVETFEPQAPDLTDVAATPEDVANVINDTTTDNSVWDRQNWIQLRKTGFTAFVTTNIDTLPLCDVDVQKEVEKKWAKITEDPFPQTTNAKAMQERVEAADGGTTVGDKITTEAGGDVKEEAPKDLTPDMPEETEPEELPVAEIPGGATEDTESLFG